MRYLFAACLLLIVASCANNKKEQSLDDKQKELAVGSLDSTFIYTAEPIGWSMDVRSDWEVLSKETLKKNTENGKKLIEEAADIEIEASGLVQLINLKKDRTNSLLSTMERFRPNDGTTYEDNVKMINEVVRQTYSSKGMKADYVEDSVLIDGLKFYLLKVTIFNKDHTDTVLQQDMYCRLIAGYDFGINLTYRGQQAKAELEKMIFSSKFSKRE